MIAQILLSFIPYALVTAYTPGPNNILALSTISNLGWRNGKNIIIGISAGFFCVMFLCAFLCYELSKSLPLVSNFLKYIGAIYIVWLAVHVARSKPGSDDETEKSSFWTGFFLQFLNVKIILFSITIYTGYVFTVSLSHEALVAAALCNTVIGVSGTLTWALAGGILQKYINKYYKPFNYAMALVLAVSALQLIIT